MSPVRDEITGQVTKSTSRARGSVWSYRGLILNFARRDLNARFKGTALGVAWSLVVPLATLAIYSIVFGLVFNGTAPVMGNGDTAPFAIFLFSGLVPWGMYSVTVMTSIVALIGTGPLMKKIYFPPYASVFGSVGATFYQSLIELALLGVALIALGNVGLTWLALPVWILVFAVFVGAVALMVSVTNVYLRDTAHLIGIMIQLQFYLTPIIYTVGQIPERYGVLRVFVEYQPLSVFVELFRDLCYSLTLGSARLWAAALGWTALAVFGSWRTYRRWGLDLSEEL